MYSTETVTINSNADVKRLPHKITVRIEHNVCPNKQEVEHKRKQVDSNNEFNYYYKATGDPTGTLNFIAGRL